MGEKWDLGRDIKHLWRELRHLNPQTASRHVFFFTADLEWCCPFSHRIGLSLLGTDASDKWADNTTGRVILVNLGDDQIVNVRPMRPRVLSLSKAIKHPPTRLFGRFGSSGASPRLAMG
jgi:hypothetical protein